MEKFNLGEVVIAKTNPSNRLSQPRKRGQVYQVTGIMYCPKHGHQLLNINYEKALLKTSVVSCSCGDDHPDKGLMWTLAENFVGSQGLKDFLDEVVAEEDYELAVILRDLKL